MSLFGKIKSAYKSYKVKQGLKRNVKLEKKLRSQEAESVRATSELKRRKKIEKAKAKINALKEFKRKQRKERYAKVVKGFRSAQKISKALNKNLRGLRKTQRKFARNQKRSRKTSMYNEFDNYDNGYYDDKIT